MSHPLLEVSAIEQPPAAYLATVGTIFTVFDERTQDSGNIAYGVRAGSERFFVKTAGHPADPQPLLSHAQRVDQLRNAVRLARAVRHPTLPPLHHVIESPEGPLLVYAWVDGELIGVRRHRRADPASAFQRFRRLPVDEILAVLDSVYDLHDLLAQAGWVAADFYDGCLIYDFTQRRVWVVDLDLYHPGPFTNTMGRMFGSSRFMAPEEFELGATIDQRTTVFTLARTALVLLGDGTLTRAAFRGSDALYAVVQRACRPGSEARHPSVADFCTAWRTARSG